MKLLKFFIESVKLNLSDQMVYKVNFFVRMMTFFSFDMVLPLVTLIMYLQTEGFPGWSLEEIILFQGIFLFVNSIDRFFFRRANWYLASDIGSGNFDRYLHKPVSTLAFLSFTTLSLEQAAQLLVSFIMIVYSIIKLDIRLSLVNIALFIIFVAAAVIFLVAIQVFQYSIIILAVKVGRLGELFTVLKRYGEYPLDIYTNMLSNVLRYIVPLAILAYVPSAVLLDRLHASFFIIAAIAVLLFILSLRFWKTSLRQYTSAGG